MSLSCSPCVFSFISFFSFFPVHQEHCEQASASSLSLVSLQFYEPSFLHRFSYFPLCSSSHLESGCVFSKLLLFMTSPCMFLSFSILCFLLQWVLNMERLCGINLSSAVIGISLNNYEEYPVVALLCFLFMFGQSFG